MRQPPYALIAISCLGQALVIAGIALIDWRIAIIVTGVLVTVWSTFLIDPDRRRRR